MCSREHHERLKTDRSLYERETYLVGWQDDGGGGEYEMTNCKVCHSTLTDGTTRPLRMKQKAA